MKMIIFFAEKQKEYVLSLILRCLRQENLVEGQDQPGVHIEFQASLG